MDLIAFGKKQIRQIASVLTRNAGDQGFFHASLPRACSIRAKSSPNLSFRLGSALFFALVAKDKADVSDGSPKCVKRVSQRIHPEFVAITLCL